MGNEPALVKFDMPQLNETGARRSPEGTAAKLVNVIMLSVLAVAFLAFSAWDTFHQTILLIQAAPSQRWQHAEKIFTAASPSLTILITALVWARRPKA